MILRCFLAFGPLPALCDVPLGLNGMEGRSYRATFRQGKVLLAFREHLNTNMVSAGSAVSFNAAEYGFQVSPGNHGIDQSIAASVSKIGFAKT